MFFAGITILSRRDCIIKIDRNAIQSQISANGHYPSVLVKIIKNEISTSCITGHVVTWVSVNSIETIKRSIIFPKHTVKSQNDVRTDFIDGGA